jgi:hypothetical protein
MVRFWMMVVLCLTLSGNVAEARGRQRMMRSQSSARWSTPVRYSTGSTRPVTRVSTPTTVNSQVPASGAAASETASTIQQASASGTDTEAGGVTNAAGSTTIEVPESAPKAISTPRTYVHPMQQWAEDEARMMAERGTCGHIRGAPAGYFVGVGCGRTCMGSGRLVAEAHYGGKSVRVWQRY